MAKICHILFEHRIFDGRIFYKEVLSLQRAGHEVVMLVPTLDNKTLGLRKEVEFKRGQIYEQEGVKFQSYKYNKKILRYFSIRQRKTISNITKKLIEIDADIYHFHEDGMLLEVAANFKNIFPNKKLIFDFHEFFLHHYRFHCKKFKKITTYLEFENQLIDSADMIFTVSDTISNYYRTLCRIPVITLMNCQSASILKGSEDSVNNKVFWVVHEGRMLFDRGIKLLLDVASKIKIPQIQFLIIGNLPNKEQYYFNQFVQQHNIQKKFKITGFLPYLEVGSWLSQGKIGINFIQSKNAQTGIQNKFFNYLRFGLPVIILKHPLMDNIISRHKIGYSFDADESDKIAKQIEELYQNQHLYNRLHENANHAFKEEYSWEIEENKLLEGYQQLLYST